MTGRLEVLAPDGVPEVVPGDDLAALVLQHCDLADGDIVAVTSKVVSKAEGRIGYGDARRCAGRRDRPRRRPPRADLDRPHTTTA